MRSQDCNISSIKKGRAHIYTPRHCPGRGQNTSRGAPGVQSNVNGVHPGFAGINTELFQGDINISGMHRGDTNVYGVHPGAVMKGA